MSQKPKNNDSIPWSEKYRPTTFEHTILEPINRRIFETIIEHKKFPHILLYGPPGVGKTTSAINLIQLYQTRHTRRNRETVIHLNASDERGIEMIRNQIYHFVRSRNMFETGLKFVILDEVDYMTKNAQQALKNLLQSSYTNVRFCLICNYICKIDTSLLNEFVCIRFNKLPDHEIHRFFQHLIEQERLVVSKDIVQQLKSRFQSDIRSMVNYLQLHHDKSYLNTTSSNHKLTESTDDIWESIHQQFCTNTSTTCILQYIRDKISTSSPTSDSAIMDVRQLLVGYFHYIIRCYPSYISPTLLNIAEIIVHETNESDENAVFFVHNLSRYYQSFYQKLKTI